MQVIVDTGLLVRALELWEQDRRDGKCTGEFDDNADITDFSVGQAETLLDYYAKAEDE